ncbi:unnamed protein product [Hymenolepis diminuta]|uniref:Uncharacterized protein n=1 Tax=Hymenolepis diminuta TaxID=6216 RepID=A0A564YIL8_HYMDI|nr:unnamed protein product [Hymenolepis diminuta]
MLTGPDIKIFRALRQHRHGASSSYLRRFCCIGSHRNRMGRFVHHIYRRTNERKTGVFQSVGEAAGDEVLSLSDALFDDTSTLGRVQDNTASESTFATINQVRAEISDSTSTKHPLETTNEEMINVEKNFEKMTIND